MMTEPLVSLCTAEHCFDVQFHPRQPLLVASTVTGEVELHRFDLEAGSAELVRKLHCHKKSCRTARFLPFAETAGVVSEGGGDAGDGGGSSGSSGGAGAIFASTGADCLAALTDVESGARLWRAKLRAEGNALLPLGDQRIAVGDDAGCIAVFDGRSKKAVLRYTENEDFISDMALTSNQRNLCATAGDGTLAVYDLRKNGTPGLLAMSDFQEDEFLSLAIIRNGTKVICGSQTGVLAMFSWGEFGDQNDRIKGHPLSVDALVRLTENCVLTGSSDGSVRVVAVQHIEHGSRILGHLAEHGEYPVERLALSADGELLASASHGQPAVRLWSTEVAHKLLKGELEASGHAAAGDAEKDSDDSDEDRPRKKQKRKKGKAPKTTDAARKAGNFFRDL